MNDICGSCWHTKDAHIGVSGHCVVETKDGECPCRKYVEE